MMEELILKITGNEFLSICDAFSHLVAKEMDLNTACSIAKNIKEMDIIKKVIDDKRNSIIKKYAKKDSNGNIITKSDGSIEEITNRDEFNAKMSDLLSQEIDINLIKISKSDLQNITISPMDILSLEKCLEE